jgi:hypothetical protein
VYDNGLVYNDEYYLLNSTHIELDKNIFVTDKIVVDFIVPYDAGHGLQSGVDGNPLLVKVSFEDVDVLFASTCNKECFDWIVDSNIESDIFFTSDYMSIDLLNRVRPTYIFGSSNELFEKVGYDVYGKGKVVYVVNGKVEFA